MRLWRIVPSLSLGAVSETVSRMSLNPTHEVLDRGVLSQDYFSLFGLQARFSIDVQALTQSWRRLQAAVHPDRFAGAGAAEQRLAMQWSTQINTAYRTLLDPQARAAYLCELRGVPIDAERNTAMPADFLMQQLQWREELDDARRAEDVGAMQMLSTVVGKAREQALSRLAELLDPMGNNPTTVAWQDQATREAATLVRVLMFLDKFRQNLALLQAPAATSQSFISAA